MMTDERLLKLKKTLSYDTVTEEFYIKGGVNNGLPADRRHLNMRIVSCGFDVSEIEEVIEVLKTVCVVRPKKVESSNEDMGDLREIILEKCHELDIFHNFKIINNKETKELLVYLKTNNSFELLCQPGEVTAEFLTKECKNRNLDTLDKLYEVFEKFTGGKVQATYDTVVKLVLNYTNVNRLFETIEVNTEPLPAVIEGVDKFALHTIPYKKEEVTIDSFGVDLKDFLTRVNNHEYLCAILWAHFVGHRNEYIVYLQGRGGDGKTAFINFLSNIVGDKAFGTYSRDNQFSNSAMYNKSIINIAENQNPHLLQDKPLKALTGGNKVSIEFKGRDAFQGYLVGLPISDSNEPLRIKGKKAETRRLRHFKVEPLDIDFENEVSGAIVTRRFTKDMNTFLNYSRQCFEKLSNKSGRIKDIPNMDKDFEAMLDPEFLARWDKFFETHKDSLDFDPSKKIEVVKITSLVMDYRKDNKFATSEFDDYLDIIKKVKKDPTNKYYLGLGNKSDIGDKV